MSNEYTVSNIHSLFASKLKDYIQAQYFGENTLLLSAGNELLNQEHLLYQDPYIESNPSYAIIENGLETAQIPESIRTILKDLSSKNIGIFSNPYQHQIEALEAYYAKSDVLVTTGTGSGKTECFLWPLIANLVNEAQNHPETWKQRGVRALLLYPMNALVADQIGRLRKIIGDSKHQFAEYFSSKSASKNARHPQFGMYTGRTPYPGLSTKSKDKELAATLRKDILKTNPAYKEELIKHGRYPAKENLEQFVEGLENNFILHNDNDAELITRHEMQASCPDILVTNYTMLQYMLIREIEQPIWEATKSWLQLSDENKLLLVIDEAHMYHGSAGGEVSLLIRRILYRLGIGRDKVRFILTSASIPSSTKEQKQKIEKFLNEITSNDIKRPFKIIQGTRKEIVIRNPKRLQPELISEMPLDSFYADESTKIQAISTFCTTLGLPTPQFTTIDECAEFLYDNLSQYDAVQRLICETSGNAKNVNELAKLVFPETSAECAANALQVLFTVLPIAKNKEGHVLFPARLHLFFRGLNGIHACTNPNCQHKHTGDNLTLGEIYSNTTNDVCKCGGHIFELINDRRCGALFLKAYMLLTEKEKTDIELWPSSGDSFDSRMREIHLYIVPTGVDFEDSKIHEGWLDPFTCILHRGKEYRYKQDGYLHVAFSFDEIKSKPGIYTFKSCPKCGARIDKVPLSDFATKGNEPFYNIVSSQLHAQPPVIFDKEILKSQPNAGRKVLIFSDSRQRAASLAKDMTRAADDDAARSILVLAATKLKDWHEKTGNPVSLKCLYPAFLEIALKNNIMLFYGNNKDLFKNDCEKITSKIERANRRNSSLDYGSLAHEFTNKPGLYSEQLLKNLCSPYRSLSDLGLCRLVPAKNYKWDDCLDDLYDIIETIDSSLPYLKDEMEREIFFRDLFSAWAHHYAIKSYAVGEDISDSVRKNITRWSFNTFGVGFDEYQKMPKTISKILKKKSFTDSQIAKLQNLLAQNYLQKGLDDQKETYYLAENDIELEFLDNCTWFRCKKCTKIFPSTLLGHCVYCGHNELEKLAPSDLKRYNFWRKPVLDAVRDKEGRTIKTVNTEEHTAQLSYKDQRHNTWSKTENYEMRFQNVLTNDEDPIDILSCTTTMEVGIDIGSLTAISLRNVPPRRENYQQRAGRAGRRGSTLSTIITYAQDGPHDGWYFNHPEEIITGDSRLPWIDSENNKLLGRHLNLIFLNEFLNKKNTELYSCDVLTFFNEYYADFLEEISQFSFKKEELRILLPETALSSDISHSFKSKLVTKMNQIQNDTFMSPEQYKDTSMLDLLSTEGILPTYSFPQNIVGFYIEDQTGKVIQKPERSLDIAISEYAPGKILVVDKKTYKVGGIYSDFAKKENGESPAAAFFRNKNYYSNLYQCSNKECGWLSTEPPKDNLCPFCHSTLKGVEKLLKPWGFAPLNHTSIPEARAEIEYSYAEEPCYFAEPLLSDLIDIGFKNLKAARRSGKITIINKGIGGFGFYVCRKCGAAEVIQPGANYGENEIKPLQYVNRPYTYRQSFTCNHDPEKVYLGHTFSTDMVVFEFSLDSRKINTEYSGLWIRSAAQTLSEAFKLSASRVLDIEFTDINAGFRIHKSNPNVYVDIFLYDSLSSGAGYSATLLDAKDDLTDAVYDLLSSCNCDSACYSCLKHYWNQRVHSQLNRHAALDLLIWGLKGEIRDKIDVTEQERLLTPLMNRFSLDSADIRLRMRGDSLTIISPNKEVMIEVYPAIQKRKRFVNNRISISDIEIKRSLPTVFADVKKLML